MNTIVGGVLWSIFMIITITSILIVIISTTSFDLRAFHQKPEKWMCNRIVVPHLNGHKQIKIRSSNGMCISINNNWIRKFVVELLPENICTFSINVMQFNCLFSERDCLPQHSSGLTMNRSLTIITRFCVCDRLGSLCLHNISLRQVGIGLGRRHIQVFMNNTYNELSTVSRECLWLFHCQNQIYLVLSVSGFRYRSKTCVLSLCVRRKRILVKLETV